MRKFLSYIILLMLVFIFTGCSSDNSNENYSIDYNDATSFENALNDDKSVKGKIVQFYVLDYKPDSILGINCHAGEHLNFLFETELDVEKGDTIIARVTEEPTKVFLIGSWKVPSEVIEIIKNTEEPDVETQNEDTSSNDSEGKKDNKESQTKKVTVTMSEDELKNLATAEAENKLRNMGFTVFKYDTLNAGDKSELDGKVGAVEIKSWEFGKGDFSKGDKYNQDAIVVIWSYKYTEPEPVSYSTNNKNTVKNGDTGVYAYKSRGGSYDIYWIIDFDEGYAYWFAHGNGDDSVDKVKIESGNLNSVVIVTYHDGNDKWSYGLHFKYKNQPDHLIAEDHNGFENDFYTTNLKKALQLRDTKRIINY